ncbi:unnamed protein product [Closterium sp. NIES-53]
MYLRRACEPASTGAAPVEALNTFTLDLGASRCFFRGCTTVTPLTTPVPITQADPSGGPVVARASTVLPCPAAPSGSLTGLHLTLFTTNLVSNNFVQDQLVTATTTGGELVAICTDSRTSTHLATFTQRPGSGLYTMTTESAQVAASGQLAASCSCRLPMHPSLLWHHRLGHPSLPHLRGMHSRLLVSGLLRSRPPLPRSPAPPCLLCVEGRQRAAPHSSAFPPTTAPLKTLHMDISIMKVARTSIIHAAAPQFLWPLAVRYAAHQLNLWPRISVPETSPTLRWTGEVGDASAFWVWGSLALVRDTTMGKLSSRTVHRAFLGFPIDAPGWRFYHPATRRVLSSQDVAFDESVGYYRLPPHSTSPVPPPPLFLVPAEGGDPAADDTAATSRSPRLETPPGFPPRPSSPPLQHDAEDSGAAGGGDTEGADSRGADSGGAGSRGAESGGAGSGGAESPCGGGVVGAPTGGARSPGGACAGGAGAGGIGAGGIGAGESVTDSREPASRPVTPFRAPRARPPPVPGTHTMALRPSSVPQCIVLPLPPASSLPAVAEPESGLAHAASPTVKRVLATLVTDPSFESTTVSALVTELVDFAATRRLEYFASIVTESESDCPPSIGGELALGCDVLEDRLFELECLAAAVPHLTSMLLCPEGDSIALDIPTPRFYAEAISGQNSSQWQTANDAEMAPGKYTGTYVNAVPPSGANIVNGMWIFKVKRPPGSLPSRRMTTLWVLLHVAAQHEYELHLLHFSTAFLLGSLHEEIWQHRPPGFTWSFPEGTLWRLRRPVYGLRQALREWHDTLSTTLVALEFAPSTADSSMFLRTDSSLPPFYILMYVSDLVFATIDTEALVLVKAKLQKRHTCTDVGELRSYLGLQITREKAARTITLIQSHMP